jgi:hypothetical protein
MLYRSIDGIAAFTKYFQRKNNDLTAGINADVRIV